VVVNARQVRSEEIPLTKGIVAINAAVFVFTEFLRHDTVNATKLGLFAPFLQQGEWYRLVTAGFLHFGLLHIFFNMMILLELGRTFEPTLGKLRFAALYLVALLGGSVGALLLEPYGLVGGASGAVFGLAAAAVVALRQRNVPFNQTRWGPLLVVNLIFTFLVPGISKGGHLGGLVFGGVAGAFLMHPRRRGRSLSQDLAGLGVLIAIALALSFVLGRNPLLTTGRLSLS
jgi:membrane associated rhomboid family serine protease